MARKQKAKGGGYIYLCEVCNTNQDLWEIFQVGPAYVTWACSPHVGEALHRMTDRIEPVFKLTRAVGGMSKMLQVPEPKEAQHNGSNHRPNLSHTWPLGRSKPNR